MRPIRVWLPVLIAVGCSSPPRREDHREPARAQALRAVIRTCIAFQTGAVTAAPAGDQFKRPAQQDAGRPDDGIPGLSQDGDRFDHVNKPGCRTVVPPAPLVAAQTALDGCAREAGAQFARVDLVVVLKNTATVTGPEPLRGCVDRELASMAPVAPATSCSIVIGDPAAMRGELPAIGSGTACPAALR